MRAGERESSGIPFTLAGYAMHSLLQGEEKDPDQQRIHTASQSDPSKPRAQALILGEH